MSEPRPERATPLRSIAPSFVVAAPTGTSTTTRLHPTAAEDAALRRIGDYLGGLYRKDLVARSQIGKVPAALNGRTGRKRELTRFTSSRWAGAITRAAEDQYKLGLRALSAEVLQLTQMTEAIQRRLNVAVGEKVGKVSGYRSAREWFAKSRRLAALTLRLADARTRETAGQPHIRVGGGRLWSNRSNLNAAGMTVVQWRERWDAARMFITADGESGQVGGNQTVRVRPDGTVQVNVPSGLASELGGKLDLSVPVTFTLRGEEWADRSTTRQSIRYDITFDADKNRWYLRASWSYKSDVPAVPLATLQAGPVIGVDLNADHLAAAIIDASGNPVSSPRTIALDVDGLSAGTRDGHLRQAVTDLLDYATDNHVTAIAIENLNFADSRATGRETMGRGGKGKRFRRLVAGIPTGKFRERLVTMAANRGIHIIAVDPAYTSRWGEQHWKKPFQTQTPNIEVTRHHAAAIAIGRRAHGHKIRRKRAGLRSQQRMTANLPALQPGLTPERVAPESEKGQPRRRSPRPPGPAGTT
jgi:IS605 OrfB family transposase